MKIKKAILILTVVSLLVAIPALAAKKDPGELGPPFLLPITQINADIDGDVVPVFFLEWTTDDPLIDPDADKYSVDVEAVATYNTGLLYEDDNPIYATVEVSASFGTSDRLDGGDMADKNLNIPVSDIEALLVELDAALEAAGLDPETPAEVEITAKVKALDSSVKPTKRQNNPFSNSQPIVLP